MNCSAFQIKTFKAYDGAEIHYVDVGSGQPMIYVCGFGSTIASQAPFIDAMRSRENHRIGSARFRHHACRR